METTLLGLMLATLSNKGKLDHRVTALLSSHPDLTPIQRKGLYMLVALNALVYTCCPRAFTIGTLVRDCNWKGRGAGSGIVAKQALEMSLLLMLNILKPEEQLATEYVKTTAIALLLYSHWHSCSLGCIHSEGLIEALLSRCQLTLVATLPIPVSNTRVIRSCDFPVSNWGRKPCVVC